MTTCINLEKIDKNDPDVILIEENSNMYCFFVYKLYRHVYGTGNSPVYNPYNPISGEKLSSETLHLLQEKYNKWYISTDQQCDITKEYNTIILPQGSKVYNGNCLPISLAGDEFWAFHPVGKSVLDRLEQVDEKDLQNILKNEVKKYDPFIMFTSSHEEAVLSYALSCKNSMAGIINVFETLTDIKMLSDPYMAGEETKFVSRCICDREPDFSGYAIVYGKNADEYAFCNPELVLKFIGSKVYNNQTEKFEWVK